MIVFLFTAEFLDYVSRYVSCIKNVLARTTAYSANMFTENYLQSERLVSVVHFDMSH
jgi:hypothetical protein